MAEANNTQSIMKGIKNSWTLMNFARTHGKMQVGEFVNKDSGETFKSCIFTNPESGNRTFVAFSSKMGNLTPAEIASQKNELQVVELEGGHFTLCKQGQNSWEDVNLGL